MPAPPVPSYAACTPQPSPVAPAPPALAGAAARAAAVLGTRLTPDEAGCVAGLVHSGLAPEV